MLRMMKFFGNRKKENAVYKPECFTPERMCTRPHLDSIGRYQIVSDGDSTNTKVYDKDGKELNKEFLISKIEWSCEAPEIATAKITVYRPKVSLKVDNLIIEKNE